MQAATWFANRKNWLPFDNQHQVKFVNEGNKEIGAQISYFKKKVTQFLFGRFSSKTKFLEF